MWWRRIRMRRKSRFYACVVCSHSNHHQVQRVSPRHIIITFTYLSTTPITSLTVKTNCHYLDMFQRTQIPPYMLSNQPPTTRHHAHDSPSVPGTMQPARPSSLLFTSRQFRDEAQVFEERDGGYDDGHGWRGRWFLSANVCVVV